MRVQTRRGAFEVRRSGTVGTPVLLLHPLALSGEVWAPLSRYLARRHAVLAVDARGHGRSEWDGGPFSVEDMADDAAAVVEELGLGPVGVVGMSMGGCTGLSLAARHPAVVERLVLADTTSCYGVDRVERWQERAEVALRKARSDQGAFQLDRWFSDAFRAADPEECQRVLEIFIGTDSRAHAAACAALGAFDGTALMPLVEADTWVLVGEQDYATPPAMAETLAGGIPHARLQVLAETRHLSLVERSDVWPLLEAYLGGGR